jgi:Na+-transporting NADH:ubiquinone oxidoreductase subunit NqrC
VQILRKLGLKEKITTYGKRIMMAEPDIGLQLFIGNQNEDIETMLNGIGGMSMTIDEVLEFFEDVWGSTENAGRSRAGFKTQDVHQRIK